MISVQRILPYTKQLVLYALYDVLDSEERNRSGFTLSVSEQPPATVLTVEISAPYGGLSRQGEQRAADYLADRVEQLLENELKISALLRTKGENIT